ncbi:MAG: co-chaperone DjlA [Chromatiales bacterium]|jgi:DnaJ like chaperone protein|nr:co-chaperone DjlA [Chromatiales bacterium]
MGWIGKVGGGIIGLLVGGPPGAIIGAALGHQFDRGAGQDEGLRGPGYNAGDPGIWSAADRQRLFFETTFHGLGALAKADGRVSEEELDSARTVMANLRLQPAAVRRAMDCFTLGKGADFPLQEHVARLRQACRSQPQLLQTFLEIQLDFLLDKPAISTGERMLLLQMARTLGVSTAGLTHLEAALRARRAFRQQRTTTTPQQTLGGAYRALDIEPDASDAEVKTAYRRLMNQYHPDKQAARGLPEDMLEDAKERTHEIRAAYDLIREHRGMR